MISYALFHVLMCHDVCQHVNISFSSSFNFLEVVHNCVTTMFFRFCIYAPRFRSGRAHLFWVAPGVSAPFGFSCFGGNVFTNVVITFPFVVLLARWL